MPTCSSKAVGPAWQRVLPCLGWLAVVGLQVVVAAEGAAEAEGAAVVEGVVVVVVAVAVAGVAEIHNSQERQGPATGWAPVRSGRAAGRPCNKAT